MNRRRQKDGLPRSLGARLSPMITFQQAREAVIVDSAPGGYEDEHDYLVILEEPRMDEVVLVRKSTGAVHLEVYFEVKDRLARMTPVNA